MGDDVKGFAKVKVINDMHCSHALRRLPLKNNQLSWAPLLSRAPPFGILPSRSLNEVKSALLKARAVMLFVLLISCRI